MAKLPSAQIPAAQAWLYDVFFMGASRQYGYSVQKDCPLDPSIGRQYWCYSYGWQDSTVKRAAEDLYQAIKFRRVNYKDFLNLDASIQTIVDNTYFYPTLDPMSIGNVRKKSISETKAAEYIAWFCSANRFFWDDTLTTPQEYKEITEQTVLGKALEEASCFISQPDVQAQAANAATAKALGNSAKSTSRASTGQGTSAGPKNDYKSLGGLSGNLANLLGTPGNKITLPGPMFSLEADKTGANTPTVFIKPLTNNGGAVKKKTDAEEVRFGSGNGYNDCRLWWESLADAKAALATCQAKFGSKYVNMRVVKQSVADPNGYYEVSTEFGPAYIKASKLNEEVLEYLDLEARGSKAKVRKVAKKGYTIENIDTFSEAFDKYMD